MPTFYYKTFKVPMWACVEESENTQKIIDWFTEREARHQPWPTEGFKETIASFKTRGWGHVFKDAKANDGVLIIPPQLLGMAITEHIRKNLGPTSALELNIAIHRLNRHVREDKDYVRILNEVMKIQDAIVLSQSFQVGEICHDEYKPKKPVLWVSGGDFDTQVIGQIADKVITIGEGKGFDLDLSKKGKKSLKNYLEEEFTKILEN